MRIRVTESVAALFRENHILSSSVVEQRWRAGSVLDVEPDASIEPYSHILSGDRLPSAIGSFSYSYSPLDCWMRIGRYCSISWDVVVMGSAHAADWATTHPLSHNPWPLPGVRAYLMKQGATSFALHKLDQGPLQINIGHDVWIGADVIIKRGVTIGVGAIIGARSVVTHDVPPYAVVAGVPARLIRYRFDKTLVARLEQSRWWDYGPDIVHAADIRDPQRFLDQLDTAVHSGSQPMVLTPVTGQQIIDAAGGPC